MSISDMLNLEAVATRPAPVF